MSKTPEDDPFFSLREDSRWNACIGRQGFEENYVDGYMDAALTLAEQVIANDLLGERDTLVLPILYNARHGVELALKFLIGRLREVGAFTATHKPDHDILSHWTFLNDQTLGDETLRLELGRLERFVRSLSNIDDDGQSFRYAVLRDGQTSLKDHSLVNVEVIRDSLGALEEILKQLKYRLQDLEYERHAGSYTTECSRLDLNVIAQLLPDRDNWDSQEFADAKYVIKKRFELSNGAFSRALDKIQGIRELKLLIGIESELAYLSDEHVVLVVEQWCALHPNRGVKMSWVGLDYLERSFEDFAQGRAEKDAVKERLLGALSNDEIADVDTLFYIGRERLFGERYEVRLKSTKREHNAKDDRWLSLHHVMIKTNFAQDFANGLERVGRPDLAVRVRDSAAPQPAQ